MEPRFYHFRPTAAISFEFIISGNLSFHFKSYISESQHGFVRGTFAQYVANSMDLGLQTDVIYTYFSKAFDRLGHEILVRKLETLGWSSILTRVVVSTLLVFMDIVLMFLIAPLVCLKDLCWDRHSSVFLLMT
jgi:hypothetical protein